MIPRSTLGRLSTPFKRTALGERLIRRNPLWYPGALRRFQRLADAPLASRRTAQERLLRVALRCAADTAYGRRVHGESKLDRWPLLEPSVVRDAPLDVVRGGRWALPAATGGTTGVPLPLWRSPRSVAVEQAALDHLLLAHGVNPVRARVAVLRGDDVKDPADRTPPYWIDLPGGGRRIFSSNHLAADTAAEYLRALTEFAADYWWVYPTTLESLVLHHHRGDCAPRVPLVFSSSEVLAPSVSEAASAAFGCRVLDYYGQAERVALAWCGSPGHWRFLPGYAQVELVPREIEGPGFHYEIVGTPFWNEVMPLVRYRTGDLIRFDAPLDEGEREAVTLGVREFPGVLGRDGDILIAPDGTRLTGIDHFHRGVERIARIQVVHERPDHVIVRILPAPGFAEAQRAQVVTNVRRKLPPSMSVEIVVADTLERTPLGKTPFVLRRAGVPAPQRGGAR